MISKSNQLKGANPQVMKNNDKCPRLQDKGGKLYGTDERAGILFAKIRGVFFSAQTQKIIDTQDENG